MFVRNWMSAPAIALTAGVTASSALAFMEKRRIRRLPVVEDGKLIGIVTKSDLLGAGKKQHVDKVTADESGRAGDQYVSHGSFAWTRVFRAATARRAGTRNARGGRASSHPVNPSRCRAAT